MEILFVLFVILVLGLVSLELVLVSSALLHDHVIINNEIIIPLDDEVLPLAAIDDGIENEVINYYISARNKFQLEYSLKPIIKLRSSTILVGKQTGVYFLLVISDDTSAPTYEKLNPGEELTYGIVEYMQNCKSSLLYRGKAFYYVDVLKKALGDNQIVYAIYSIGYDASLVTPPILVSIIFSRAKMYSCCDLLVRPVVDDNVEVFVDTGAKSYGGKYASDNIRTFTSSYLDQVNTFSTAINSTV